MGWPRIPTKQIFSDTVRFRSQAWTSDSVAGRQPTPGPWGRSVRCSVSAASAQEVTIHSSEQLTVSHVVTLDGTNYSGLKIRDQALWDERDSILTIVAIEPAGDRSGRIWNLYCEERPRS